MNTRRSRRLLVPLLALGLTLVVAASAGAQDRRYPGDSGTSATLRIMFGSTPRWTSISGTRVEEIRDGERPSHDMFRVNGSYYAYSNDRWYMSRSDRGDFNMIDDRAVPADLRGVSREHWRSYPRGWSDQNDNQGTRTTASLRITFGSTPRWSSISGSRVEEIREGERPDYDLFRLDGGYYAYNNDHWYSSRTGQGEFIMIDDGSLPDELTRVPRDHWRNYPRGWGDSNGRPDYQDRTYSSLEINLGSRPRWWGIRGTRVQEMRGGGRPDYDVFRYAGVYYIFRYDRWYMSRSGRGRFVAIDNRNVPFELSRIPRNHWRTYPTAWMDEQRGRRDRGNRRY